MIKKEGWIARTAEDLLSLGSMALYIVIVARALIGPYWLFFIQLVAAAAVLFLLSLAVKNADNRISRALILAILTVLFYHEIKFTIFVSVLSLIVLASAIQLKIAKKAVLKSAVLGMASAAVSYYLAALIANFFNLPV